ncbi:MAG: CinA family protein, partial [Planctomycetota bacterium]|nr:CinA family protein [Planctomycetota bacterium]
MTTEEEIKDLATKLNLTVAITEATTGGLICSRLVRVPGSSAYFERGIIAYSKQSKIELLGITEEYLSEHGAVSAKSAEGMAEGIRRNAGTALGGDGGSAERACPVAAIAEVAATTSAVAIAAIAAAAAAVATI